MFRSVFFVIMCLVLVGTSSAQADGFETFLQGILAGLKEYTVQVDNQQVRVWTLLNYIDTHQNGYVFEKKTNSAGVTSSILNISKVIDQFYSEKGFAILPLIKDGHGYVSGRPQHTVVGSIEQIADRVDLIKYYIQTGKPYDPSLRNDPIRVARFQELFKRKADIERELKEMESRKWYARAGASRSELRWVDDVINSEALESPRYGWDKEGDIQAILGKSNSAPGWTGAHNLLIEKVSELGDLLTDGRFSEQYPVKGRISGLVRSGRFLIEHFNNMLESLNFEVEKFKSQDKTTGVDWKAILDDGIRELEAELKDKRGEWGPSVTATIQETPDAKNRKRVTIKFVSKNPEFVSSNLGDVEVRQGGEVELAPEALIPYIQSYQIRNGSGGGIRGVLQSFISGNIEKSVEVTASRNISAADLARSFIRNNTATGENTGLAGRVFTSDTPVSRQNNGQVIRAKNVGPKNLNLPEIAKGSVSLELTSPSSAVLTQRFNSGLGGIDAKISFEQVSPTTVRVRDVGYGVGLAGNFAAAGHMGVFDLEDGVKRAVTGLQNKSFQTLSAPKESALRESQLEWCERNMKF